MEEYKIIYKILRALEKEYKGENTDKAYTAGALEINEVYWGNLIQSLLKSGYIEGVRVTKNVFDETLLDCRHIKITLDGLDYLRNNNKMRQIAKFVLGHIVVMV